jgi:hypothetical protein
MKKALLASLAFAGLVASAAAAGAGPLGSTAPAGESLVTNVATYVCIRDDHGWHYMRGSSRVTCRPERPKDHPQFWAWHCDGPRCGWWHKKEHRYFD